MKKTETYGLTHIAIAVSDVERTLQFYRDVFGMQVMYHQKDMIQLSTPGCHDILVFEEKNKENAGKTGGIVHFGFRLRKPGDIRKVMEKVQKAGGTLIEHGEFVPGSPFVFFKDPDGYIIEVWYEYD